MNQLTPMQDLLQDLKETKITSFEALNNIENKHVRECCQISVEKTLNVIIERIETELLPKEQQVIDENKKMKSLLFDVVEQSSETIKVNSMGASETYYQLMGQIEQLLQH